ncbi:MAG: RecX family transcriptional regulator [Spirochaetes bacterium]|nr:RecX family transcriptional regulator [Spirochaetota bacterium]
MVTMSAIQQIKKAKNHISIELDTGECLAIPHRIAKQFQFTEGKILENEEYRQLKLESERYQCKQKALDYLSIKNRTSHELRKYLLKKGFSADIIAEVTMELTDAKIVDDIKYAIEYARMRKNKKLVGKRLIQSELKQKGLPNAAIRKALEESNYSEAQIEEVIELARKKFRAIGMKKNALRKVSFFLSQRGFEYELIQKVIEQLQHEEQKREGVRDA